MSLTRRSALLAVPLGLAGCSALDNLFSDNKQPIAGKREPILPPRASPEDALDTRPVTIPPPQPLAAWPMSGGSLTHAVGNVAVSGLKPTWDSDVGAGGGYRAKLTAQPVVEQGAVYTMDSDGEVSAFDLARGSRRWRTDTQGDEDRSTNVGGGIAVQNGIIYATTGRGEALAITAATGNILWRQNIHVPARSGPTLANGRMHFTTLDNQVLALGLAKGERVWGYPGTSEATTVLADAAPAIADGFVVAGLGSGELVTLRADSGTLVWSDTLASSGGRNSALDLASIRALPVIDNGRVFAVGVSGVLVSLDLRTGRRLWERDVGGGQTPALAGDWMFVLTGDQRLWAINANDGRVRWRQELPRWANVAKQSDPIYWAGPLLAGSKLVVAGGTGMAVSADPITGHILGSTSLSSPVTLGPVAAEGTLLILCTDGTLQAFR